MLMVGSSRRWSRFMYHRSEQTTTRVKPPGGTATATRPTPAKPPVEFLPLFRVLLHNDDVSAADFVVSAIVELTPLNHDRAVQVMLEAHTTGVGLLLVSHKERA